MAVKGYQAKKYFSFTAHVKYPSNCVVADVYFFLHNGMYSTNIEKKTTSFSLQNVNSRMKEINFHVYFFFVHFLLDLCSCS